MDEIMYCEKCGWIGHVLFSKTCKNCQIKMKLLPENMKYKYHIFVEDWTKISNDEIIQRKENFVMSELNNNPLFSIEEYNKQINRQIETNRQIDKYHEQQKIDNQIKSKPVIECPYCHSTNTKKITNASKAIHTAVFGIFSVSRNSKNYHCNNCNSDF